MTAVELTLGDHPADLSVAHLTETPDTRVVGLSLNDVFTPLTPDDARRLAVRLIETAAQAERPTSAWPDDEGRD